MVGALTSSKPLRKLCAHPSRRECLFMLPLGAARAFDLDYLWALPLQSIVLAIPSCTFPDCLRPSYPAPIRMCLSRRILSASPA